MASDKIKVAVRVRPFNKREESLGTNNIVSMKANQTVLHHPDENETHKQPKSFTFDHCFDSMYPTSSSFADQEAVFDALGKDILTNAFKGYNACIIAYGQTGSGKSYSMMGGQADRGIIPRLCVSLFEKIGQVSGSDTEAKVEVSYMEIYNEKVHDLLDLGQTGGTNKTGLKVREHKVLGPYVDGLSQLAVENYQEIEDLMIEGNKSRTVAATNMNNESSGSHAVFTIIVTFTLTDPISGVSGEKVSKMSLVDLAGSERANKTGALGDRLKEGSNINKSLTTLGLVISKLAEQSQSSKASKQGDKFVPYRDSVLTWLLKDNLGGNSKTVMVATISPSADNYEETLSTLRYADRAKRIVNHAVINEDPNARIIRELRAEVEALKDMLLHAAQPEVLKEKLCENEKLMKEMSLTWEEKLHKTEQKQEDRRHAMEKMGISVQSSGIKVEKNKYFLVNLNADPSLNELLVYYLKDQILVGRSDAKVVQDIQLSGLGIQSEHCVIEINNKELWINPIPGARTCVNGREIVSQTQLKNGDRLLWGSNHFFRVNCPRINAEDSKPGAARTPLTPFDWRMAQEEVMMAESTSAPMKEAMARLEKQHEEEKQTALENQRKEYEKQFKQLKYLMSPTAALEQSFPPFSPIDVAKHRPSLGGPTNGFARINSSEDSFKSGLSRLREDIVRANGLVREANLLAEEVGNPTRFSVTLQIPSHNLTPNRKRGSFVSEAAIQVKRRQKNGVEMESQVWSLERLDHKLVDMREVYEEVNGIDKSEGMSTVVDPFFEENENHTFIGVANIFLDILLHDVKLCYQTPIISQQGEVAGRLQIEIERTGGLFPQDRLGHCETNSECSEASSGSIGSEDSESAPTITCKLAIKGATGISPSFSQFVFCQYRFWGEVEVTTVTPVVQTSQHQNIFFNHTRDVFLPVSEELLDYCTEGALSIEVFGLRSSPDENTLQLGPGPGHWVQESQGAQARSLADRWLELTRKLELRLDIQELNEAGDYTPVEVLPRDDVGAGGVMQLRQGQQRRVCVTVRPVASSGMLPLICDAITSIEIGSPCIRSKLQKPLDSYQEEDLNRLRDCWSEALARRREYLDSQIQNFLKKPDKNESEKEREQSLVEQWVNLTEERNAVLAPTENSGVPGAPTPCDKIPEPGMELHSPVLFLSLNSSEFNEESASPFFEADVPVHGNNSILPKEHGGRFFSLPIIRYLNQDLGAVASWDSSIHDSVYLNQITDCNERAYLIVKVVVRLSHPTVMDLVLRKRVCFNIFKRQSLTDKIRRRMGHSSSVESVGVIYEVVSSVPTASQELEDRASLAAAAASGQEVQPCGLTTGETFIEKYTRGAAAVDEILRLDRLRQNVAIKEILASRMKESNPIQSMRKTLSVPNIRSVMRGSLSLDNISHRTQLQQLRPQESFQELNLELSSPNNGRQVENNHSFDEECKSGGSGGSSSNNAGWRRLPMSMTMSTLHEERIIRQDIDFSNPLAPSRETGNQGSGNKSPGGNERIVEVNGITSSLPKSQTVESLSELQMKTEAPSLVSSGYESQAMSSTTISSNEDSLSIRSMSVEESTECGPEVGEGQLNFRSDMRDMEMSTVSQNSSGTEEEKDLTTASNLSVTFPEWLVEGESVQVRPSSHSGVVRFLGPTSFASGPWVGVELDAPQGKNDGSVEGVRYFSCGTKRGMFVRPKNLRLDKRGRDLRATKKSQQ